MKNRETDEWLAQNDRSTRNFIRKWGSMVHHDEYLKPIITPKYDIGFKLKGDCDYRLLRDIEPWCTSIYVEDDKLIEEYIKGEQPNTKFDLSEKFSKFPFHNDIVVEFEPFRLTQHNWNVLVSLPYIIQDSGEIGEFELDIFKIFITTMKKREKELINCHTD